MKLRIAVRNVQHTAESIDRPLFYSRKVRKANNFTEQQTINYLFDKFITFHFETQTQLDGNIISTNDFMSREIAVNLNNNLVFLDANYVELTDTNGEITYWFIDNIEWITDESVKLKLTMDGWVSYFKNIAFKGNRITPKRYTYPRFIQGSNPNQFLPDIQNPSSPLWVKDESEYNDKVPIKNLIPLKNGENDLVMLRDNPTGVSPRKALTTNLYAYAFFTYNNKDSYRPDIDMAEGALPQPLLVAPVLSADDDNKFNSNRTNTSYFSNTYGNIVKYGGVGNLVSIILSPLNWFSLLPDGASDLYVYMKNDGNICSGRAGTSCLDNESADIQDVKCIEYSKLIGTIGNFYGKNADIFSEDGATPLTPNYGLLGYDLDKSKISDTDAWDTNKEPKLLTQDYTEFILREGGKKTFSFGVEHLGGDYTLKMDYASSPLFNSTGLILRLGETNANLSLDKINTFTTSLSIDSEIGSLSNSYTEYMKNHKSVYNNSLAQGRFNFAKPLSTPVKSLTKPLATGAGEIDSVFHLRAITGFSDDLKRQAEHYTNNNVKTELDLFGATTLNGDYITLTIERVPQAQLESYGWYYHRFGYKSNRPMVIGSWDDIADRSEFNYIEIDNMEEEGLDLITFGLPEITEHIDKLFSTGIRLFSVKDDGSTDIGNYSNANYDNEVLGYVV